MNRVVHFEIQADKPDRAMKFYKDVFGWTFQQWGDQKYWMIMTDSVNSPQPADKDSKEPGINGGLLPRPAKTPAKEQGTNAYVCTMEVKNFGEIAKKIEKAGGLVAMPKFALPGIAWQGYFMDTEGNTFGVHQPDKNAK
ncbi:MAG: glyoxalase [Candidatus Zambryskibacteria bacterium RIFCSPHIGHO2_01_FULL_49_18]|uniref:Glyoxalase n=1 Tax=Candidatus Zambryskibacteria bacterium RIFCSPHIGHO2_01_FULL_49_18 TaxID=1802740 RepID=A0A1G2T2D5_9BACT|nr:MAG: glyoxalase [Candidatus Zambryskibacteria bacterium RIFCSPHIGHO2_01_FULL_49_18]